MKIQTLAVIFVLIILPISIVLSEYVQVQIDTLNVQTAYDSQLLSATYDAVVAFQKNTVNSWSSDLTSSKMRDIEASANVFLNSVANNFRMSGNTKDAIKEYIPAVVYTLYDGYYIYSPFFNTIEDAGIEDGSYKNGEKIYGLKPYIYYSRAYNIDTQNDFVITYSLDNYITIQGKINNEYVNDSGYLIDINDINTKSDGSEYKGAEIYDGNNDEITQYVNKDDNYKCVKINGIKYYKDDSSIFSYVGNGNDKVEDVSKESYFNSFSPAREYYKKAYEFTDRVINTYKLGGLYSNDAKVKQEDQANYKIFDVENIEDYNSGFNQERRAVIKYAIEKNLSSAIANYNNLTTTTANFQMPRLKDDEWDNIINNVSVISFLQGLNMGNKQYNGYSIVTNNKNEEVVAENSIYITTADNQYHRVNDKELLNGVELKQGIFNMNFERKSIPTYNSTTGETEKIQYFYPNKEYACYNSIVNQTNVDSMIDSNGKPKSIYKYLNNISNKKLASLYYTALGRERWGMYRVNNPFLK